MLDDHLNADRHGGDVRADIRRLPFKDGSFVLIRAWSVIEHISEQDMAWREMYRVLEPGGVLDVRVPYGLASLYDPWHVKAFNEWTFEVLTQERNCLQSMTGWKFRSMRRLYHLPFRWHLKHYLGFIDWDSLPLRRLGQLRVSLTKEEAP